MLTLFLPTNPDTQDEYVEDAEALTVGDLVDGDQVVAVYPYYPLSLCCAERVQLVITHPADQPVPPKEEWYCWENRLYAPRQCWHIVMDGAEVLRVREKPAGQLPELGRPLVDHYFFPNDQEPKLDRASVAKLAGEIKAIGTGLILESATKHVSPDAPYAEIYVIQAVQAKVLQAA